MAGPLFQGNPVTGGLLWPPSPEKTPSSPPNQKNQKKRNSRFRDLTLPAGQMSQIEDRRVAPAAALARGRLRRRRRALRRRDSGKRAPATRLGRKKKENAKGSLSPLSRPIGSLIGHFGRKLPKCPPSYNYKSDALRGKMVNCHFKISISSSFNNSERR